MCFSAEASFGLSGVLVPAGVYCVWMASRKHLLHLFAAVIPLAFALQQVIEGVVWIGLQREDQQLVTDASLAYLFFALFFWPFWIPLTRLLLEPRWKHRLIVVGLTILGLAVGLGLFLPVLADPDIVITSMQGHSLRYQYGSSAVYALLAPAVWTLLYMLAIFGSLLLAERRDIAAVGVVVILLAGITQYLFASNFLSLWCFFAAAVSLYLCWYFHGLEPAAQPK